jgi:hypothetical protein
VVRMRDGCRTGSQNGPRPSVFSEIGRSLPPIAGKPMRRSILGTAVPRGDVQWTHRRNGRLLVWREAHKGTTWTEWFEPRWRLSNPSADFGRLVEHMRQTALFD